VIEHDLFGEDVTQKHASALAKTWDYPPFTVLNAREGWWQERKRAWLALGIQSELGRADDSHSNSMGGGQQGPIRAGGAN
jgi:hypothetical protein